MHRRLTHFCHGLLTLGYVALQERPTAWTALGAALVLGGVVLALAYNAPARLRR